MYCVKEIPAICFLHYSTETYSFYNSKYSIFDVLMVRVYKVTHSIPINVQNKKHQQYINSANNDCFYPIILLRSLY